MTGFRQEFIIDGTKHKSNAERNKKNKKNVFVYYSKTIKFKILVVLGKAKCVLYSYFCYFSKITSICFAFKVWQFKIITKSTFELFSKLHKKFKTVVN